MSSSTRALLLAAALSSVPAGAATYVWNGWSFDTGSSTYRNRWGAKLWLKDGGLAASSFASRTATVSSDVYIYSPPEETIYQNASGSINWTHHHIGLDVNANVTSLRVWGGIKLMPYDYSRYGTKTDYSGTTNSTTLGIQNYLEVNGDVQFNVRIQLQGNNTWNIASGSTLTTSRVISTQISGANVLTKTGSGGLILLSSANSFNGGLDIQSGYVQIGDAGADGMGTTNGAITGTNAYTIASGADLSVYRSNASTLLGTINGHGYLSNMGAGRLTVGSIGTTGAAGLRVDTGYYNHGEGLAGITVNQTVNGALQNTWITGYGAFGKAGAALLDLNNVTMSHEGGTVVSGGVLRLLGVTDLPSGGPLTMSGGGVLQFYRDQTVGAVSITGNAEIWGPRIWLDDNVLIQPTTASSTVSVDTVLDGSGGLNIYRYRVGTSTTYYNPTVDLWRDNDFYGTTNLGTGATLRLQSGNALQYSPLNKTGGSLIFSLNNGSATTNAQYRIGGLSGTSGFALRTADGLNAVTLTVEQHDDTVFSGALTGGGGSLVKEGSGMLVLSGSNTFTGELKVTNGSVHIGAGGTSGSIATTAISIHDGGELALNRSDDFTFGASVKGEEPIYNANGDVIDYTPKHSAGSVRKLGDGAMTLATDTAANTYWIAVGKIYLDAGKISGDANLIRSDVATSYGTTLIFNQAASSSLPYYTDVYSKVISGVGTVEKTGTGTLVLNAAQTYTGATTVKAGTLRWGRSNVFNTSAQTWFLAGFAGDGDNRITLAGGDLDIGAYSDSVGNVHLNSSGSSIEGTTGVLSASSIIANFTGTTAIRAKLGGTGSLSKEGTGTLELRAANTHSGTSSVYAGTLRLHHGDALSMSTLNMVGGAVVFDSTAGTNTFNLGGLASDGSGLGRDINLRNNATSPAAVSLVVGANNQYAVYRGTLSGTGSLTKVGAGTQVLAGGASTFTDGITIQQGILQFGESPSDGYALSPSVGFNVSIASGASLVIKQGAGSYFYAKYSGQGSVVVDGGTWWQGVYGSRQLYTGGTYIRNGGTLRTDHAEQMPYGQAVYLEGGNFDITGYWSYGAGETIGQLSITGSGTSSVVGAGRYLSTTGVVANNSGNASIGVNLQGAGGVSKSGSGTLTLSGTNSYTGATTVSAGVLAVTGSSALGSGAAGVTVASGAELRMGGAAVSGKALSLSGSGIGSAGSLRSSTGTNTWAGAISLAADSRINADSGSTLALGSATAISGSGRTLTVGGAGGVTIAGGIATGSGGLVKDGSGSLTLGGTSTYAGTTTLSAGTLTVNGSVQSSQAVTMAAGTTLGGTGSVAGAINVGAGASTRLVAGNGTSGTLTVGSLNFLGAATLGIGPVSNYTSSSAFVVNGGISFGGGAGSVALNLAGSSIANGVYRFVTFGSGTVDTSKFSVTGAALSPTQSGLLFLDGNTVTYAVTGHQMVWTGAVNGNWDTQTANWQVNGTATAYSNGQNLLFNDASERRSIEVAPSLAPVALNFDNGSGKDYVIAGSGISSGILHKRGSGKLTVRGSHGFTGGSRIEGGGSVRLGGANALGLGRIELHNGRISSEGSASRSLSNTLAIASDAAALGDASDNGELTFTGDIDLMASSRVLEVASTVKVAGRILGNSLDKRGSGTLAIVANNAYQGGLLLINGGAVSIGAGTSQGSLSSNIVNNATLRFERTDSLTYAGSISGTGAVVVQGGGALTLTGDSSTRTGSTTVSSSQLVVNGVLGGTLALGAGSSLGGSGTVLGNATIAGTHAPGNSPGIQTFGGNLTYQSGASVNWQLVANSESNSPTVLFDQIHVGGSLHFGAVTPLVLDFKDTGSTVDWSNSFWSSNRSWVLYQVTGNISGSHLLTLSNTGYEDANGAMLADVRDEAYFRLVRSSGQILLTYAIPEASTYGLILGGLALAGAAVRRRRKAAK